MSDKLKIFDKWFGGICRDDKSTIVGALSNCEEVDIFANQDYVQAEQIFTEELGPTGATGSWDLGEGVGVTGPAGPSSIYAYDVSPSDTVYAYGTETLNGRVRILNVTNGGATNPGAFSTLFTSAEASKLATPVSDFKFFRTSESPTDYLYYIRGTSTTWELARYSITAGTEATVGVLTGLNGTNMRPTMKIMYGDLFILHGQFIARVDSSGLFQEKTYTLENNWEAIDIIPVSAVAVILARHKDIKCNYSKGFWWDTVEENHYDDAFNIPMGGPQWISNHKETIKMLCAINGTARIFQLSGAFPGAVPVELPGISINNVGIETSTQPISSPKMVGTKDKLMYFNLFKTDKSGMYVVGQIDSDKTNAFVLSKRFATTDYSKHSPTALFIQGSNFYASYSDNGTPKSVRCETLNSPTRSSNAIVEGVWFDGGFPYQYKSLSRAYVSSYPLSSGTSLALSVASDFSSSYIDIKRADNSIFNTANGLLGLFRPSAFTNKLAFRFKVSFASNGILSPKLQTVGLRFSIKELE